MSHDAEMSAIDNPKILLDRIRVFFEKRGP